MICQLIWRSYSQSSSRDHGHAIVPAKRPALARKRYVMTALQRTLTAVVASLLLTVAFGGSHISAASYTHDYTWWEIVCNPGDWCQSFSGTYRGSAWWTSGSGTNYFTKHESTNVVYPGHPDVTNPTMTMRFYHSGTENFEIYT